VELGSSDYESLIKLVIIRRKSNSATGT